MTTQDGILEGLITKPELARTLGKTERTVDRLMNQADGLPFLRIGKTPYFRVESVKAWILSRETQRCPAGRRGRAA